MVLLMSNEVWAIRRSLTSNGWFWLPVISNGKKPVDDGWQIPRKRDARFINKPLLFALNTGLLCNGLRVVDIDVNELERVKAIYALAVTMLGDAPVRYRDNSPRILLPYRAAVGEPKKRYVTSTSFRGGPDNQLEKIEVLGHGRQFVAYQTHNSGAEIRWSPDAPHLHSLTDLTAVTEEQIGAFLAAAASIIGAPGEGVREATAPAGPPTHGVCGAQPHVASPTPGIWRMTDFEAWLKQRLDWLRKERPAGEHTSYVAKVVNDEIKQLATRTVNRNTELNIAALKLGELAHIVPEQFIIDLLWGATIANGYIDKDGKDEAYKTLCSGLNRGKRQPRQLLNRRIEGIDDVAKRFAK